jgi:hypothetical protein
VKVEHDVKVEKNDQDDMDEKYRTGKTREYNPTRGKARTIRSSSGLLINSLKLSQPVMFVVGVTSAQKPSWVVNSPAAVLFQYPQQLN